MCLSSCDSDTQTELPSQQSWTIPVLLFVTAALLYMLNLDRLPHHDELYHILAAQGLLESGEPRIAQGSYERVFAYTWMLSRLFSVFGESLAVARMPSVLAMAAVVTLIYIWLNRQAGASAATIASILFAVSPFAIDIALFTRFYAFQTLAFFIAAMAFYALFENRRKHKSLSLAIIVFALLTAVYLQKTTLIGVTGLMLWAAGSLCYPWYQSTEVDRARKALVTLGVVAALAFCLLVAVQTGLLAKVWDTYRATPLFGQSKASDFWFYLVHFQLLYPTLWPAVAILTLVALAARFKPAFFAAVVFFVSLGVSSFAAAKGLRYIIYAQPFLFIVLGIALSDVMSSLGRWLTDVRDRLAVLAPFKRALAQKVAAAVLVFCGLVLVIFNPATLASIGLLSNIAVPPNKPRVDWAAASSDIVDRFSEVDVVVTMAELEMLYYYGSYDVMLSASRLSELPDGMDFDADYRTGKPVIGSVSALEKVFACYASGLFVTSVRRWRHPDYISAELANLIAGHAEKLPLPAKSRVMAFVWDQPLDDHEETDCTTMPRFTDT